MDVEQVGPEVNVDIMNRCNKCGGKMKPVDAIERVIDGHRVRVLKPPVYRCVNCGHIVLNWMSYEDIDLMLRSQLKQKKFEEITWNKLVTGETSSGFLPS